MKWTSEQNKKLIELGSSSKDFDKIAQEIYQLYDVKHSGPACKIQYYKLINKPEDPETELSLKQIMTKKSKKEYIRLWRLQHEDEYRAYYKKYNRSAKYKQIAKIKREELYQDVNYRLARSIRNALYRLMKSKTNIKTSILDYSSNQLKEHLEKHFHSIMDFNNYGSVWSIKFINAPENFNLKNKEEFEKASSLKNLTVDYSK